MSVTLLVIFLNITKSHLGSHIRLSSQHNIVAINDHNLTDTNLAYLRSICSHQPGWWLTLEQAEPYAAVSSINVSPGLTIVKSTGSVPSVILSSFMRTTV